MSVVYSLYTQHGKMLRFITCRISLKSHHERNCRQCVMNKQPLAFVYLSGSLSQTTETSQEFTLSSLHFLESIWLLGIKLDTWPLHTSEDNEVTKGGPDFFLRLTLLQTLWFLGINRETHVSCMLAKTSKSYDASKSWILFQNSHFKI